MLRVQPLAALVLLAGIGVGEPVAADAFQPSPEEAARLVRAHRTNGYVTVGETLAQAERARPDVFRFAGIRAEQRPGERFTRVRLCYWLRGPDDPASAGERVRPTCGIGFAVSRNPTHVEPVRRFEGLARDLQDGPEALIRGLDRERALLLDPGARMLRAVLDPFELYDPR